MRQSYKKALTQLTELAQKEGFENIVLNHDGVSMIHWYDSSLNKPKSILIEDNHPLEIKTYLFLHELGHHELRKDWNKFSKTLPIAAYAEKRQIEKRDDKFKRRVTYAVACMEEEYKAWDEGLKLAAKLGIKVNLKKWNTFRSSCLIAYLRYYGAAK